MKLLLLLLFPVLANAQYAGPGVETCLGYAKRQLQRDAVNARDVVIERDQHLVIERYTRKAGSQFVSSILTGNGAVVFANAPSAELSFICLLADDKRAVYFDWLPRANVQPLAQCTRDGAIRDKPQACLELLLRVAEEDLTQAYAVQFQDARERDQGAGNENAITAFRKSNEEWRQYREAECARRLDTRPKGAAGDEHRLACMVELTRRRALDMR